MKLCVFPNDPLIRYFEKGEIKERYFNPCNIFNEIHIISFIDKEVEDVKIQTMVGNAKLKIHCVGKINFFNKSKKERKIKKILEEMSPDVIRSYNSLLEGWVAAKCSEKLKIPLFVSIHVQYDGLRKIAKKISYKKFFALKMYRREIEPYVLKQAKKITIVYKIIEPYVINLSGKTPEILYNRIDLKRFQNGKKIRNYKKPLLLSVGRLTSQKNHDCIIKAIKELDVHLMIIGDGEEKESLFELVSELNLEKNITFKNSVPNKEIQDYYKTADIFVLAYDPEVEGVPIPVLEAMASKLPIIITKPIPQLSDGLEGNVLFAELNPEDFAIKIKKLLEDEEFAENLSQKALIKSKDFDGENTEKREAEIYKELLSTGKKSQ